MSKRFDEIQINRSPCRYTGNNIIMYAWKLLPGDTTTMELPAKTFRPTCTYKNQTAYNGHCLESGRGAVGARVVRYENKMEITFWVRAQWKQKSGEERKRERQKEKKKKKESNKNSWEEKEHYFTARRIFTLCMLKNMFRPSGWMIRINYLKHAAAKETYCSYNFVRKCKRIFFLNIF